MVYLIGVSHGVRFLTTKEELPRTASFAQYLRERAKELNAVLIAEQLSEERLNRCPTLVSVGRSISKELEIEHKFCSPNSNDRKTFGIPSLIEIKRQLELEGVLIHNEEVIPEYEERKYFRRREAFWFKKIEDEAGKSVIFICESEHVESFRRLLVENGIKAGVLEGNWLGFSGPGDSTALQAVGNLDKQ
jgi:hypothetical protein